MCLSQVACDIRPTVVAYCGMFVKGTDALHIEAKCLPCPLHEHIQHWGGTQNQCHVDILMSQGQGHGI